MLVNSSWLRLIRRACLCAGIAVIASAQISFAQEEEMETVPMVNPDGMVEVEPSFTAINRTNGSYELVPYAERRGKWGNQVSIGYSMYTPQFYESEFSAFVYEEAYGLSSDMPLIELQYTFKRNLKFGSIGAELGIGFYSNTSDIEGLDSELQLIPVRLGATLILDQLFRSPYVAPYVSGGGYMMVFTETLEGQNTFEGNTQVAPYFTFGAQVNLDWLDPISARQGYEDNGIQATFMYVEGRKFMASSAARDRDFENEIEPNIGLRVEF